MRICIDLDGTICEVRKPGQLYADVNPLPGAVEALKTLKQNGHYIIIATARNMKTLNNNLGLITAIQGPIVIEWLKKHNISYDELWFGKPLYHCVIDDRAIHFDTWETTLDEVAQRKEDF